MFEWSQEAKFSKRFLDDRCSRERGLRDTQSVSRESPTYGASKVPDLPPDLWVRRMSTMRMARSTALHMS